MSEAGTKKKALANFFAKGKAKKAGGAGDDAESPSTAAAPTTKSSSSSSSSAAIAASVGIGGDWDEDSTKVASVLGLNVAAKKDVESIGARLGRVGLADVTEEEMAAALGEYDGEQVDIDAEEAKKALWATLKKSAAKKKAAPAAPEPAAAPAASSTMTFAQQAALRRAGQAAAPLRKGQDLSQALQNTAAFPTLGRAASGLPPGAQFAEAEQSIEQAHKSKNAWAALAGGDDEEEEEEEEEQAPAPAPATAPAKAAPASAAVAAADPFSISEADLVQGSPSAPALKDEAAFVATAKKIMSELASSRDISEALRRFQDELKPAAGDESSLSSLRQKALEAVIENALNAESDSERVDTGLLLAKLVVPGKVVTASTLASAFKLFVVELYDDLKPDIPKLPLYLAALLTGKDCSGNAANNNKAAGDVKGVAAQGIVSFDSMPKAVAEAVEKAIGGRPAASTSAAPAPAAEGGDAEAEGGAGEKKKKKKVVF